MAYVRSLREIPIDQEPHASVLAAFTPEPGESPSTATTWETATAAQLAHLRACPVCREIVGGYGQVSVGQTDIAAISIGA
jgi:hypothetical protein